MRNITLALCSVLALTACNNSSDDQPQVGTQETSSTVATFTTMPQFKLNRLTRYKTDQVELNFSKSVSIIFELFDINSHSVYQYTSTAPTSEYTLNVGSEYNDTLLDYGAYHYNLTLLRDGKSQTLTGNFNKGIRLIHQFDEKVSDLSVSDDQLYVATGDYLRAVEVHQIDTRNDRVSTLALDTTLLPKPIYDMKIQDNTLFLAGRKEQWMGGQLLSQYSLIDQSLTVLDDGLGCQDAAGRECSAVFSLQPLGETLYIGSSNGLYTKTGNHFEKVAETGLNADTDIKTQFIDQQGRLWIGSMAEGGIAVKNGQHWQAFTEQNSDLPAGGFMDFAQMPSGEILMASNINGLVKYSPETQEWQHFTPANSEVLDHNLVSVAYRDGVIVGSHDYGTAKSKNLSQWQVSDHTNSEILTINTDACEFDPDSSSCKQVIVVERMVTDNDGRVFAAIGKGIYELY